MTTAVAVSGGMDSLAAMALLQGAGEDVLAVHGLFTPTDPQAERRIATLETQCGSLAIPLHVVDLKDEFFREVIRPFGESYAAGRTPNPCAVCNPRVKFGLLMDRALDLGADRFATGHYARIAELGPGSLTIARGADPAKEQSYFLSLVPASRWERVTFPLADWTKAQARQELARRGLAPAVSGESNEICFVPDDDYPAYLLSLGLDLPGPGPVMLHDGREVGRHAGLWRYTPGQRRGLGVAWSEPLYVLEKDAERNALVVGPKRETWSAGCDVGEAVAHAPADILAEMLAGPVWLRTRYRQQAKPATVELAPDGRGFRVLFSEPSSPPAPGQVAAVYDAAGRVLAAGIIERALWETE